MSEEKEEIKIQIPHKDSWIGKEIDITNGLVIVGANGSGKTRLGAFIKKEEHSVLGIKAQRFLNISREVDVLAYEKLISLLQATGNNADRKIPEESFDYVYQILFKNYYLRINQYIESDESSKKPKTSLHEIQGVWKYLFPYRHFIIGSDKILVSQANSDGIYNASEMSDGEKMIFYLVGQCVIFFNNNNYKNIILIDEPETHLHTSIRSKFWDTIEKISRDDSGKHYFIYITHDTDFAASRTKAKKIWLKSYHCTQDDKGQITSEAWDWEEIEENKDLPEKLLLELLGSRKPVLFVEGEYSSFDYQLYKVLFPDLLIKPVDNCEEVIKLTKAFLPEKQEGKTSSFHHINAFGVIDRDVRVDKEIKSLKNSNVFVMSVAEIENLICVPEVLEILWKDKLDDVQNLALEQFKKEKDNQILKRVASEIKHQISRCKLEGSEDFNALKEALSNFVNTDDKNKSKKTIDQIHEDTIKKVAEILPKDDQTSITEEQYKQILEFYNGKDLAEKIAQELEYKGGKKELFNALIDYINESKDNRQKAIKALSPYLNGLVEAIEGKPENK